MKKRLLITNVFLVFAVLFAMLFQSVHSYEHFEEELAQKKCHHSHTSKHEITHQHHNFDHCMVCNFQMSHFTGAAIFTFKPQNIIIHSGYTFFKSRSITEFFKGSLFVLRGPPVFIA